MAGDWIKVERATLRKSEVTTIARLLGVPRHQAIGILLEFWCWIDEVAVDGVVDACVDADVDATLSTPGLAAALCVVGWLSFEPHNNGLTGRAIIPNAGRHFGESSKNRALKNERQARWRAKTVDGHVDAPPSTKASTREEKRRDISTNVDIESAPTNEHRDLATQLGVDCSGEWQKYRDYLKAHGKRHKDVAAGFRNWLRKAAEFRPAKRVGQETLAARRAANVDRLTGRVRDGGVAERVDRPIVLAIAGDLREPGADDVGGGGAGGGPGGVGRLARAV